MGYKLLLADADETLFDFETGEKNAISLTFEHFGYPVTAQSIATYHRVNEAQWKRLERGETTSERLRVDRFADFLRESRLSGDPARLCEVFMRNLGNQSIAIDGAEAFCKAASAHMPIVLVTNGIASIQHNRVNHSALRPYLSGVVISEELGVTKPNPRMAEEAMRLAGVSDKRECILMGDSLTADIPCARNAGIDSINFTNGADPIENHGATYVAKTYADALNILL